MRKLSIVVSCYNEEEALPLFYKEMEKVKKREFSHTTEFEYIFVDDGSTDKTLNIIKAIRDENPSVRYISFSRNFGKDAAMLAGLEAATGDYICVMDADLQDPPWVLASMEAALTKEGYDIAAAKRTTRKGEPPIRSFFARIFYKIINKLAAIELVDGARDYRMMTRQVAEAVLSLKEYHRFTKGLFCFVGFQTKWIAYENTERSAGKTKWSFIKLFQYALDGITAFSTLPLHFATFAGVFFCFSSVLAFLGMTAGTLIYGNPFSDRFFLTCLIIFFA